MDVKTYSQDVLYTYTRNVRVHDEWLYIYKHQNAITYQTKPKIAIMYYDRIFIFQLLIFTSQDKEKSRGTSHVDPWHPSLWLTQDVVFLDSVYTYM